MAIENTHAPVVLFVFNRLLHTKLTIEALLNNFGSLDTPLIIFSDGPKNSLQSMQVDAVRLYLYSVQGFKSIEIYEQKINIGLSKSIINGVTHVLNQYDQVIVLEDDLITSKYFLDFMNEGLHKYKNEMK